MGEVLVFEVNKAQQPFSPRSPCRLGPNYILRANQETRLFVLMHCGVPPDEGPNSDLWTVVGSRNSTLKARVSGWTCIIGGATVRESTRQS